MRYSFWLYASVLVLALLSASDAAPSSPTAGKSARNAACKATRAAWRAVPEDKRTLTTNEACQAGKQARKLQRREACQTARSTCKKACKRACKNDEDAKECKKNCRKDGIEKDGIISCQAQCHAAKQAWDDAAPWTNATWASLALEAAKKPALLEDTESVVADPTAHKEQEDESDLEADGSDAEEKEEEQETEPLKHHLGPKREVKAAHQKQVVAMTIGPMGTLHTQQTDHVLAEGGDRSMRREKRSKEVTSGGPGAASAEFALGDGDGDDDDDGDGDGVGDGEGDGNGDGDGDDDGDEFPSETESSASAEFALGDGDEDGDERG